MVEEQMIYPRKYAGEWIITCNNKIIGHNKDLRKLKNVIRNCKKIPTLTKIPKGNVLII